MRTKSLCRLVEQPQEVEFWGQKYTITPRLLTRRFGDGKKLIHVTPLNTRPDYYVVCVGSRWQTDNCADPDVGPLLCDRIDDILDAIEDQFGSAHCGSCGGHYGEDCCAACDGELWADFPALNDDAGVCWGELEVADLQDHKAVRS